MEKYAKALRHAYRWDRDNRRLVECRSLMEALGVSPESPGLFPRIISLAGAGGKTTAMYRLAWELSGLGKRVLVTTTTHIAEPAWGKVLEIDHVRQVPETAWEESRGKIREVAARSSMPGAAWSKPGQEIREATDSSMPGRIWQPPVVTAGRREPRTAAGGIQKLAMPEGLEEAAELERLLAFCDVILIEADGAACRPVKVPREGEPVILPETEVLVGCVGLSCLGQTWKDVCFRFESDGAWLGRSGGERICPDSVAQLLSDRRGTQKNLPAETCRYQIVLNQADDDGKIRQAEAIIRALPESLQENCAVTGYTLPGEARLPEEACITVCPNEEEA